MTYRGIYGWRGKSGRQEMLERAHVHVRQMISVRDSPLSERDCREARSRVFELAACRAPGSIFVVGPKPGRQASEPGKELPSRNA